MTWDSIQVSQIDEEMNYSDVQTGLSIPISLDSMRGFKAFDLSNNYNIPIL